MYDKLTRVLRHCGNPNVSCKGCPDEDDCVGADGAWEIGAMANMRAAAEAIEELSKPRWTPVTEKNHPKAYEPVMVIYIGWNDALPHRDCTAYWSEDEGLWRWAETNDKAKVTITHYMPLPPLPEPPKEEA